MLTDQFLNLACSACIADDPLFTAQVAEDCYNILSFYETQEDGIPLASKNKFDLIKILAKFRSEGQSPQVLLEKVRSSGKYVDLDSYLKIAMTKTPLLTKNKVAEICSQITSKRRMVHSIDDFQQLKDFVENFESNGYDSIDAALHAYENTVTGMYARLSDAKRNDQTTAIRSLDLYEGDYEPVLQQIEDNNSGKNVVTTGYRELDDHMAGGFQPGRLYIFAGTSNDGKSTLLMNFIKNQLDKPEERVRDDDDFDIYIYVTMENLIDESLVRLYASVAHEDSRKAVKDIPGIRAKLPKILKEKQENTKSRIIMEFFPARTITVNEIIQLIEEIREKYGDKGHIKGIYVDYLDLIRSSTKFDMYRLELGQVAIELKLLAVTQQIPVITVTQLNRSGYDKGDKLSLGMMGESIKKVEHADFVGLIRAVEDTENYKISLNEDEGIVIIYIGKNRNGPKSKQVNLKTNFSQCLVSESISGSICIIDAEKLTAQDKGDPAGLNKLFGAEPEKKELDAAIL